MPENDWTGAPALDEDELATLETVGLYEFTLEDESDIFEDDNEMVLHIGGAANGAKSLREAAERLYDFADELIEMSEEGWEIVDDVDNGHATAVQFGDEDPSEVL